MENAIIRDTRSYIIRQRCELARVRARRGRRRDKQEPRRVGRAVQKAGGEGLLLTVRVGGESIDGILLELAVLLAHLRSPAP